MRKLKATLHACPDCGYEVEMFSDEMRRRCPKCRKMVVKEALPSCASYCAAARECLGSERWARFLEQCGDDLPKAARAERAGAAKEAEAAVDCPEVPAGGTGAGQGGTTG